jgi:hypothetical protein
MANDENKPTGVGKKIDLGNTVPKPKDSLRPKDGDKSKK